MSASNNSSDMANKINQQSIGMTAGTTQNYLNSISKKSEAAVTPVVSQNSYLDFSKSIKNTADINNYENFVQTKQAFFQSANAATPMESVTNQAKVEAIAQPMVSICENIDTTTSFKVEKLEDKPTVIVNHFEGDVTTSTQHSPLTKATTGMFGQLLMNFYNAFGHLNTEKIKGPGFAAVFAALCFVVPTPAFAASAAAMTATGATVVAQSNMTRLLKSVMCAGMAAVITVTFIHPIDVVKTRMQVAEKGQGGIGQVVGGAFKAEGAGAFYKGIGPAWLREASYTSLRLGLYEPVKVLVGATANAGFFRKFLAGAIAGAIGSCAGNPFDVLKTRMMADKTSNKGLGEVAGEIMKLEGMKGFYKGFNVNVMRAMVLNATKMACYDTCKAYMITAFAVEGLLLQFMAAFTAGFIMTCTVAPFDMCRTLLMNQKADENGKMPYSSLGDCFMQIFRESGPAGFYKGFIPIWTRFAPTTCLQLIIFDQLKTLKFFALA